LTAAAKGSRAWLACKLLLTAGLLYLALRRIDLAGAGRALGALRAVSVLGIAVLLGVQLVVIAVRWRRALSALGLRSSLRPLIADLFVGAAFNLLLPSTVGGDVVRGMRCAQRHPEAPAAAWLSLLVERMTGLCALGILPLLGVAVFGSGQLPAWVAPLSAGVSLAAFLSLLLARWPLEQLARILGTRLPRVAAEVTRCATALGTISGAARLELLAWSTLAQLLSLGILGLAALDIAGPGALRPIALGAPLIWVLSVVPITIGGFGLRETLFIGVLGSLGVAADQALALSLVWLGQALGSAAVGLVIHLFGGARVTR